MFRSAIAAMKLLRREVSGLMSSGIKLISCVISSWTRSSFSIDRDSGVGGGCLGYGGRFGVDFDLCKSRGRRERVDLVFRSMFSI